MQEAVQVGKQSSHRPSGCPHARLLALGQLGENKRKVWPWRTGQLLQPWQPWRRLRTVLGPHV
eukprot:357504-Chlamydomonas_euryale.AAC.1